MVFKSAMWIWMPDSTCGRERSAPLFRREFALEGEATSAILRICGLGCYEAFINGQRVGDSVLDPAQTDYDIRCLYARYDVSSMLAPGANCIGVMLGDGWFSQELVWSRSMSYGEPRMIASLEIKTAEGATTQIVSDSSWQCSRGPVASNNIYAGETYDARLERKGWNMPGYDPGSQPRHFKWEQCGVAEPPGGRLEEQQIPPMKVIELLRPLSISEPQPGCHVVDMGQNFSGWARIKVNALPGSAIRMRFAERLDGNGMIDTASTGLFATNVEQCDTYICKGGGLETWEPRFTYHGYRYVEIAGWPGKPSLEDVIGVVVHSALKPAGSFSCSDEKLNQLHGMALWTHRSNIHGIPEDCPARERCGWLGDAHIVCRYSFYNFDGEAFWGKFLDDIETSRLRNGGLPPFIAPGKRNWGNASPDWMAAMILIPWRHYLHYGKLATLEKHWDGMRAVIRHFKEISDNWLLPHGLGDLFEPGLTPAPSLTPPVKTSTIIFGDCASAMSSAAQALGQGDEAKVFAEWASCIRSAFQKAFYDPVKCSFGSQTADAMALHCGFAPEGKEQAVADSLAADVRMRDIHLSTGIIGLQFIFESLTSYGHGELALALMRQESHPGFGCWIANGATTLWEYWGGSGKVDAAHGPRSLNHPMMGGFDTWFYNTLAGIKPDAQGPGFKRFILAPHPIAGISWVDCVHHSPMGRIASKWELKGAEFKWRIEVPPGAIAMALQPGCVAPVAVQPGCHDFTSAI